MRSFLTQWVLAALSPKKGNGDDDDDDDDDNHNSKMVIFPRVYDDEGEEYTQLDNASVSYTGEPKDRELTKVPVIAQMDPTNRPIT